jgi:hypothetical protein
MPRINVGHPASQAIDSASPAEVRFEVGVLTMTGWNAIGLRACIGCCRAKCLTNEATPVP